MFKDTCEEVHYGIISIAKGWKWPKWLLNVNWLSELSYIQIMEHYADIPENVKYLLIWKTLQDI